LKSNAHQTFGIRQGMMEARSDDKHYHSDTLQKPIKFSCMSSVFDESLNESNILNQDNEIIQNTPTMTKLFSTFDEIDTEENMLLKEMVRRLM